MPNQETVTTSQEALDKCRKLMALALDEKSGNTEEARTAALTCLKTMKASGLSPYPDEFIANVQKSVDGVKALVAQAKAAKEQKTQNIMIGIGIGFLAPRLLKGLRL
jgi:hypothetical protein